MSASVDAQTGKIDFVDATLYCSFALLCDALGLIPGVAYVSSPMSLLTFKIFFWLKGVNPPGGNAALLGGSTCEMIPIVSEVLPGCTGYVLMVCAGEMMGGTITETAGAVAQSPIAPPQARLAASAVGAAAAIQQGQGSQDATPQQNPGTTNGGVIAGSAGAGASGPGQERAEQAAGASSSGGAASNMNATISAGGGGDFSGQVDFSSFGQATSTRGEARTPSGLPQAGPAGAGRSGLPTGGSDDGTDGRFAGGSPTSPGGAPTDPQAQAKMRRLSGGTPRSIKPTRIYSMEDERKAKERRENEERLDREKRAA